jgi:trigger factor
LASTYEDPEEVINYYYGNQQQLQEVQSMVLEETVVDNLLAEATVNDKECSYEDVMTPEAPPEAEED